MMDSEVVKTISNYLGVGGLMLAMAFFSIKGMLSLRSEKTSQQPNEVHNAQLETFRLIAHDANIRADTFAAERNDLLVKVTRVEGELSRLSDVVVQNDRLRIVVDQKDAAIRAMIADHSAATRQMLEMIQSKDSVLMEQAKSIATLEEAMRNVQEQVCRHQPNGTVTTTVTTAK